MSTRPLGFFQLALIFFLVVLGNTTPAYSQISTPDKELVLSADTIETNKHKNFLDWKCSSNCKRKFSFL